MSAVDPDDLKAWLVQVVKTVDDANQARMDEMDKRLDTMEQQLALLTTAYGEMAVMIQTILATKFNEVDQALFQDAFKENFKHMLSIFQDASHQAQTDHGQFHPGSSYIDDSDPEAGVPDSSTS